MNDHFTKTGSGQTT
jgi:hypothetical protein